MCRIEATARVATVAEIDGGSVRDKETAHLNKVTGGGTTSVGGGNDAGGNRFSGWNTGRRGLPPGLDITKV